MTFMFSRVLSYRINALSNQIGLTGNISTVSKSKNVIELAYSSFEPTGHQSLREPPLVILHGLFGSKRNWNALARIFSNSGRRVITVDARNHGDSTHNDGMDYHTMSDDIERLLEKLSINKAIILGHSMGGKTAMCLAITKPHLVDKLIVEDVAPNSSRRGDTTEYPAYINAMKNVYFDDSVTSLSQARQAADKQLHKVFPDTFIRGFVLTNIRQVKSGFEWKVNLDSIANHLDDLVGFPDDLQGSYNGDTLFIGGGESNHIKPGDVPIIKSMFPNVKIEFIPGAGHWVHSSKPKELVDMVQNFIEEKSS